MAQHTFPPDQFFYEGSDDTVKLGDAASFRVWTARTGGVDITNSMTRVDGFTALSHDGSGNILAEVDGTRPWMLGPNTLNGVEIVAVYVDSGGAERYAIYADDLLTEALLNSAELTYYRVIGDGSDEGPGIQAKIDGIADGATGLVFLTGGNCRIGTTINLKGGVKLVGGGGYDAASQPATQLKALPSLVGDILKYSNADASVLWHHGGLERLRIRDAPAGHGVNIDGGMGENTTINDVLITGCSGDGLRVAGSSTPLHIGHIAPHSNGGAGVRLVTQSETHIQILYLGGDANGESLLTIDTLSTTSSVHVMGWKAERWGTTPGHPDVFRINNGNGALINLGQGRVHIGSGVPESTGAIIHQTGSPARVEISCVVHTATGTSYLYGYQDEANAVTYTVADVTRARTTIGAPPRFLTPNSSAAFLVGRASDSPGLYWYTGTPENVITAYPGSICLATNGTVYKKYTGAAATGWRSMLGVDFFGAKGSLLAGSAGTAGGNFSVGTNTNVLVADSTQTFGLRWDPSGGRNYTTAGRPAATAVPIGTMIYNTTTSIPNWSDGTNWKDAAGAAA